MYVGLHEKQHILSYPNIYLTEIRNPLMDGWGWGKVIRKPLMGGIKRHLKLSSVVTNNVILP